MNQAAPVPPRTLRPLEWTQEPARAPLRPPRLSVALAILSLVMQLTISANLLFIMGIHYDIPGGNPLFKINPATDVAVLALLVRLFETGDPLAALVRLFAANRLTALFIGSIVVCIVYSLASVGITGSAALIDSYLSAGILMLVLADASDAQRRALGIILLGLFTLNVTIAVAEDVTRHHLVPFYIGNFRHIARSGNFRGVALYDHPLTGAMMTAMSMFLLLQMRLRPLFAALLVGWTAIGLFAFGGRAALVATFAALIAMGAWSLLADLIGRRLTMVRLLAVLGVLTAGAIIAWFVITQTAIADRIVHQAYLDNSARAREIDWRIPGMMTLHEILFGVKVDRLPQIVYQLGLSYPFSDVENFWLLAFINLGLVGFSVYLVGFLAFLADLWRRVPIFGRAMLLVIIAVASTSDSLGRKSNILFVLTGALIATTGYAERRAQTQAATSPHDDPPMIDPPLIASAKTGAAPGRWKPVLAPLAAPTRK